MSDPSDIYHSFPEGVTAFESAGTITTSINVDGNLYEQLNIPGSYAGQDGVFEFGKINNVIVHRFLNPE